MCTAIATIVGRFDYYDYIILSFEFNCQLCLSITVNLDYLCGFLFSIYLIISLFLPSVSYIVFNPLYLFSLPKRISFLPSNCVSFHFTYYSDEHYEISSGSVPGGRFLHETIYRWVLFHSTIFFIISYHWFSSCRYIQSNRVGTKSCSTFLAVIIFCELTIYIMCNWLFHTPSFYFLCFRFQWSREYYYCRHFTKKAF